MNFFLTISKVEIKSDKIYFIIIFIMNKVSKRIIFYLIPIFLLGCQMKVSEKRDNFEINDNFKKNDNPNNFNIRNEDDLEKDEYGFFKIDEVRKVRGGNVQIWDWKDFVAFSFFDIASFARKAAILKAPTIVFPNFQVKNGTYPSLTYNCENNLIDIEEGDAISKFKLSLKKPPVYTFRFGGPDGITGVSNGQGNKWEDIRIVGKNVYFDGQPKFDLPWVESLNFNQEFTNLIQEYNFIEMSIREEGSRDGIYFAWQLEKPYKEYELKSACSLLNANKVTIPVRGR